MPIPNKTTLPRVASLATQIPDIPRVNSRLLQIPGFQEFGAQQQEWWDIVRRRIAFEKGNTDQRIVATDNELASLTETVTLIAGSGSALASRVTTLEAEVQTPTMGLLARVSVIESAYVDASGAYAQAITAISAELTGPTGTIFASVQSEATARATADGALATDITNVIAAYQAADTTIAASVVTEATARANADTALSSLITSLTATVGTNTAAITTEATARATADGFLGGKYTLTVAAGDVVTGMNITSASGPGTNISEVTFQADRFRIFTSTSGNIPVFDVTSTNVRLLANVQILGSLTLGQVTGTGTLAAQNSADWASQVTGTGKPANNADVTLTALNGELSLTGGGLVLASGGAKVRSGQTTYDTGTGFWLGLDGATPKFSIGNSAGNKLTWDGTSLGVVGSITGTSSIDVGTGISRTTISNSGANFGDTSGYHIKVVNTSGSVSLAFYDAASVIGGLSEGPGGFFLTGLDQINGTVAFLQTLQALSTTDDPFTSNSPVFTNGSMRIAQRGLVGGDFYVNGDIYLGTNATLNRWIYDGNGDRVIRERSTINPVTLSDVIDVLKHHGLCVI